MTADVVEAPDPRDAEAPLPSRQRPLGLFILMALSVGRILIEAVALIAPQGNAVLDWIGSGSNVPVFDPGSPVWLVGRGVIVAMLLLTAASVVGLWRYRNWGWSLALMLSGLILAVDIGWWVAGQPRYPGMFLNMVAVFYLNQRDVRAIFLPSSL
jgi:hypothetical protein